MATNATPTFTPATNFQGTNGQAVGVTYDTTYPAFGLSVYKNYDSYHQRNMFLNEHITGAVEMCCGAHYYSRGKHTTLYRKAEVTVNLNQITVDTKGLRAAFISMSVVGDYGACDLGLKNVGSGWYPFYYSYTTNTSGQGSVVSGATKVKMLLETSRANNKDVMKISYTWYNSSGAQISASGNNASLTFSPAANTIFGIDGGVPMHRFQRFMSLVPLGSYTPAGDSNDGSKLIGGNFVNTKLYLANGSSVTWGTDLMDYIWTVQGWNISSFSPGNNDTFSCTHSNYVY